MLAIEERLLTSIEDFPEERSQLLRIPEVAEARTEQYTKARGFRTAAAQRLEDQGYRGELERMSTFEVFRVMVHGVRDYYDYYRYHDYLETEEEQAIADQRAMLADEELRDRNCGWSFRGLAGMIDPPTMKELISYYCDDPDAIHVDLMKRTPVWVILEAASPTGGLYEAGDLLGMARDLNRVSESLLGYMRGALGGRLEKYKRSFATGDLDEDIIEDVYHGGAGLDVLDCVTTYDYIMHAIADNQRALRAVGAARRIKAALDETSGGDDGAF